MIKISGRSSEVQQMVDSCTYARQVASCVTAGWSPEREKAKKSGAVGWRARLGPDARTGMVMERVVGWKDQDCFRSHLSLSLVGFHQLHGLIRPTGPALGMPPPVERRGGWKFLSIINSPSPTYPHVLSQIKHFISAPLYAQHSAGFPPLALPLPMKHVHPTPCQWP